MNPNEPHEAVPGDSNTVCTACGRWESNGIHVVPYRDDDGAVPAAVQACMTDLEALEVLGAGVCGNCGLPVTHYRGWTGGEVFASHDNTGRRECPAVDELRAENERLRDFLAYEASTLRSCHVGRDAVENPVDAAHLADLIDAALSVAPQPGPGELPCAYHFTDGKMCRCDLSRGHAGMHHCPCADRVASLPVEPATDCPFCAIVNAGASAKVVREWDDALCIEPLNPVTPGHLLVMPKAHVQSFFSSPDVSALTMRRASELLHGVERHHDPRDYNIITSIGPAATQTVKHLHVHVVPRTHGDGLALPWAHGPVSGTAPEGQR